MNFNEYLKKYIFLINSKFFLIIALIFYCLLILKFKDLSNSDLTVADTGSYINFSFDDLEIFFSQHRSFGLPVFLKIYYEIFGTYSNWGYFNLLFFFISIIFFIQVLFKYNYNQIFNGSLIYGIFFTHGILNEFEYVNTDIFGLCLLILSLCCFIIYINKYRTLYFVFFVCLLTYTILTRNSYITFIPSFIIYFYLEKYKNINLIKFLFFKFNKYSVIFLPLAVFVIFRYLIIGDIGLVSFKGTFAAHNSFIFIETSQVKNLNKENQKFAKKIIERRSKLTFPCNLNIYQISKENIGVIEYKDKCYNDYLMSVWLLKIEDHYGDKPNVSIEYVYEPWKQMNLSEFFNVKNNVIDQELQNLFIDVVKNNFTDYVKVMVVQSFYKGFLGYIFSIKYLLIFFSSILLLVYFIFNFNSKNYKLENNKEINFIIFNILNYFLLLFVASVGHYPIARFFIFQCIFLFPAIFGIIFLRLIK